MKYQINVEQVAKFASESLSTHLGNRAIRNRLKPGDQGYAKFVPIGIGHRIPSSQPIESFKDLRRLHLDAMVQELIEQLDTHDARFFSFQPMMFAAGVGPGDMKAGIQTHKHVEVLAMHAYFNGEHTHVLSLLASVLPAK